MQTNDQNRPPPAANRVVRLDRFDKMNGLVRGRPMLVEVLWHLIKWAFFLTAIPWPSALKRWLLILFGAKIGRGFVIRPMVNIHFPWKLEVGEHCWIGDDCGILNLAPVALGNHVAIAHRVYMASGNHDYTDSTMPYMNRPTIIEDGVWVASCVFIGPGVTVGNHAVIGAGSVVTKDVAPWVVVAGNPAVPVRQRVLRK